MKTLILFWLALSSINGTAKSPQEAAIERGQNAAKKGLEAAKSGPEAAQKGIAAAQRNKDKAQEASAGKDGSTMRLPIRSHWQ